MVRMVSLLRILVVALLIVGDAQAFTRFSTGDKCEAGDPLCDADLSVEERPAQRKQTPPRSGKNIDKSRAELKSVLDRLKEGWEKPPAATPKPTPAPTPEPENRPKNYTEKNTTDGASVIFENDGLDGSAPKIDRIKVLPFDKKTEFNCFDTVLKPALESGDFLKIKAAYRQMLKCNNPCATDKDLDFLSECVDWADIEQTLKEQDNEDAPLSFPAGSKCSESDFENARRQGRFDDGYADEAGRCVLKVSTETSDLFGRGKADIVVLIDNSGSMSGTGQAAVKAVLPAILETSRELKVDAKLLLMTQGLETKNIPQIIDARDPEIGKKTERLLQSFYYGEYESDANERPLMALTTQLPHTMRPEADIIILALTDEPDSSTDKSPEAYAEALRALTIKKLTLNATEPAGGPLAKVVKLTNGFNVALDPQEIKAEILSKLSIMLTLDEKLDVGLKYEAQEIYSFQFDGRELQADEYRLNAERRILTLNFPVDSTNEIHKISVTYKTTTPEPKPAASKLVFVPKTERRRNRAYPGHYCGIVSDFRNPQKGNDSYRDWDIRDEKGNPTSCVAYILDAKVDKSSKTPHRKVAKDWALNTLKNFIGSQWYSTDIPVYEKRLILRHLHDGVLEASDVWNLNPSNQDLVDLMKAIESPYASGMFKLLEAMGEERIKNFLLSLSEQDLSYFAETLEYDRRQKEARKISKTESQLYGAFFHFITPIDSIRWERGICFLRQREHETFTNDDVAAWAKKTRFPALFSKMKERSDEMRLLLAIGCSK